jgi:hypothetical protein
MDLNFQYARHQRSLMLAQSSSCRDERRRMLDRAALIAGSIATHQTNLGAAAATGWSLAT